MVRELQGWVAQAIHAERAARGITVRSLARKAGLTERVLARALTCERDLHMQQLAAIANALGVRPSFLILEGERRQRMASPAERAALLISADSLLSATQKATLIGDIEHIPEVLPSSGSSLSGNDATDGEVRHSAG